MHVRDIMTRDVVSVSPGAPLRDIARILVERGISGLPVVDADGVVVGVVSEADFVLKERGADRARRRPLARLFGGAETRAELAKVEARTAGEAMTTPALTIDAEASVREAADLMTRRQVNRLPVLERGRIVGIVTRADLVKVFLRSDDELVRAVAAEIGARTSIRPEPGGVELDVRDGVVHLAGTVERRSLAETAEAIARDVSGVVRVESHLAWTLDDVRRPGPSADRDSPMDMPMPQP